MKRGSERLASLWFAWLALLAALAAPTQAAAQLSPADRALATELFQRGRRLMIEQKDYVQACPLLEESQRLDPAGGTLLNLALCHAQLGRTATAWSEFHDALAMARSARRPDRVEYALAQIAELEGKLSRLSVDVSAAQQIPGLTVDRDGSVLGRSAWGAPMAVDPGEHVVRATAPGHHSFEARVEVGAAGTIHTVVVPALAPIAPVAQVAVPRAPPPSVAVRPQSPSQRERPMARPTKVAWALAGTATASALVATVLGVRAFALRGQAEARCLAGRCPERAYDLNDRARRHAAGSTALSILAGTSGAFALLLWVAPRARDRAAAEVGLRGSF